MENNPKEEIAEPIEEEMHEDYTQIETYLLGAYYALSSLDLLNPMTEAEARFKKNKTNKCYKIIGFCVDQFYSEIFPQ
jgi:hypothetical protein